MYFQPKTLLSRLVGAAWSILFISGLLWLAVHLLAEVWIWIVVIIVLVIAVRIGFWWRSVHREYW